MKLPVLLALSLTAALAGHAAPGTADLTLVNETGLNEVTISFVPPLLPSGSSTTKLTGVIQVVLEIDPDVDEVSQLTITDGTVAGTAITLSESNFFGSYNLTSSALGAELSTPLPPGLVDPATGNFDAAQHSFAVNTGTLGGNISVPLLSLNETISFDFSATPIGGAGSGMGNVTLTPAGSTATTKTYDVVVTLPLDIAEVFVVSGQNINITAIGTVKAAGPVTVDTVPPNPFVTWTVDNSIPGATFDGDENGDGVPNGLQWALGLEPTGNPWLHLLKPAGPKTFRLSPPISGTAADILIETGSDLTGWTPLDSASVSVGNPIPEGTSDQVVITLPDAPGPSFVRGSVMNPGP